MKQGRSVRVAAVLGLAMCGAAPVTAQDYDDCDHRRAISETLSLSSVSEVLVAAGAGRLEVRGVRGLREARIRGTACASDASLLAEIGVFTRTSGGVARIETEFPDDMDGAHARIDLVVELPAGMAAQVHDGSGDMELTGLGELDVHDGSGELTISDIAGDLTVTDGSGTLTIRNVSGGARITDGSGEVEVTDVGGVRIIDGSGSIVVNGVRGDLVVEQDGSGSVDFSAVRGRVDVPERRRRGW